MTVEGTNVGVGIVNCEVVALGDGTGKAVCVIDGTGVLVASTVAMLTESVAISTGSPRPDPRDRVHALITIITARHRRPKRLSALLLSVSILRCASLRGEFEYLVIVVLSLVQIVVP